MPKLPNIESITKQIMLLHIKGMPTAHIAKKIGKSIPTVRQVINSPLFQAEVARINGEIEKGFITETISTEMDVKKALIQELAPLAIKSLKTILDPKSNIGIQKAEIQQITAADILDRISSTAKKHSSTSPSSATALTEIRIDQNLLEKALNVPNINTAEPILSGA